MRGVLLVLVLHFGDRPGSDPWLGADKAKHFFTSAFVQTLSFSALRAAGAGRGRALWGATAASSAIGIGKDLYDRKFGGDPSLKDLTWDGAGIAAATVLLRRTER